MILSSSGVSGLSSSGAGRGASLVSEVFPFHRLRTEGAGGCFGKALSHHNQNVFSFLLKLNLVEDEERS
ncbi:hypothetical protein Tco_1166369 [Tanacetum coccineum]